MRKFISLIVVTICCAGIVRAGQIYGSVKEGSRSVGEGVEVSINCGGKPISARTDSYGSYKLYVPNSGKCTLSIYYQNQWSQPFPVFSDQEPLRYDFELVKQSDGSLTLKRR